MSRPYARHQTIDAGDILKNDRILDYVKEMERSKERERIIKAIRKMRSDNYPAETIARDPNGWDAGWDMGLHDVIDMLEMEAGRNRDGASGKPERADSGKPVEGEEA